MAKAKLVTEEIETVVKTKEERVNLSLTMVEARTPYDILQRIGGDPKNTARKYVDEISNSLREAGINPKNYQLRNKIFDVDSKIVFLTGSHKLV